MTRILAVADEVADVLYGNALHELRPDLVVACGDLPFEYLEYLVSRLDKPVLYVPGNHDADLRPPDTRWAPLTYDYSVPGPLGCMNVDGRVVEAGGLRIAGLGGSLRYREGPNQYTEAQMRRRALGLELRQRAGRLVGARGLDILLTHAPPYGFSDGEDGPHRGFTSLLRLVAKVSPQLLIHGHVHSHRRQRPDGRLGDTTIVNAIPYRLLEV